MDKATKTGLDEAKTASRGVTQKTAEAPGDLIGNNTADKTTSTGKSKKKKPKETEKIYIPRAKRQQIIDNLKLF